MVVLAKPVKVLKTGTSLAFTIPSFIADALCLSPEEELFVSRDREEVVYSREPRDGARKVKVRVITRAYGRNYYILTIPSTIADALKIRRGDVVLVELRGNEIRIRKASSP